MNNSNFDLTGENKHKNKIAQSQDLNNNQMKQVVQRQVVLSNQNNFDLREDQEDLINKNAKENNSKDSLIKKVVIIILVIFIFFFFTSESSSQKQKQYEKQLQIQDNLPEKQEEKQQHSNLIDQRPEIIESNAKFSQIIQSSYHDPNSPYKLSYSSNSRNYPLRCSQYLPYNILDAPPNNYYKWYGKVGKNIAGTTYQTGHLYQRHLAVNQKCTYSQKKDKKTVFLNITQLYIALSAVYFPCNLHNHTQFQFSQNGKVQRKIIGIDCKTGQKKEFDSYFILYKRAVQNSSPSQSQYMKSMFTTLWTFYPSR